MTRDAVAMAAREFCQLIGCSGVDKSCPGNLNCSIVQKVIPESNSDAGRVLTYTIGQQVIWSSQPHGGYGYILDVPAVVVAITPKRVKICAALKAGGLKVVTVHPHNIRSAEESK